MKLILCILSVATLAFGHFVWAGPGQAGAEGIEPASKPPVYDTCGLILMDGFQPDSTLVRMTREESDSILQTALRTFPGFGVGISYEDFYYPANVEQAIRFVSQNLDHQEREIQKDPDSEGLLENHKKMTVVLVALKVRLSFLRGYSIEN